MALAALLAVPAGRAQGPLFGLDLSSDQAQSLIGAGLGYTGLSGGIRDGNFLAFTLQPEFTVVNAGELGNLALGFGATLRYDVENGTFRKEDFDEARDFVGLVQYVRFGQEGVNPLYGRFGRLDAATLGNGQQVGLYRNEVALDAQQRGFDLALDGGIVGLEGMFGSITDPGVFGARAFTRPFHRRGGLLGLIRAGVSVAGDLNDEGAYVNPVAPGQPFLLDPTDPRADSLVAVGDQEGRLLMVGADLSLPFLTGAGMELSAYADVNQILGHGMGAAAGLGFTYAPEGAAGRMMARLELRYLGAEYLPNYFNAFYETERIGQEFAVAGDSTSAVYNTKRNLLAGKTATEGGIAGILEGHFLNLIRVTGSYQQSFEVANSGWFHLGADVGSVTDNRIVARAAFDRWNIGGDNVFSFADRNTRLSADVGFKPIPYLLVGLHAQRSFAPILAEDDPNAPGSGSTIVGYQPQDVLEPLVQLLVTF